MNTPPLESPNDSPPSLLTASNVNERDEPGLVPAEATTFWPQACTASPAPSIQPLGCVALLNVLLTSAPRSVPRPNTYSPLPASLPALVHKGAYDGNASAIFQMRRSLFGSSKTAVVVYELPA